jgi:hypothetical protein
MSDLDRIIDVTITRQTSTPSMASFSGTMIAAEFLASSTTPVFATTERVRSYGSLAEVLAGGFATSTVVYKAAQAAFSQNPRPAKIYVGRKLTGADGTETWDVALAAIKLANADWYAMIADTRTMAQQQVIIPWVEANDKLYICASGDANVVDAASGDIADWAKTGKYDRTAVAYHPLHGTGTDPYMDAALLGKMLTKQPGSATWAFKTLVGVPVYSLTSAQITKALAKYAMFYTSVADVYVTQNGQVASGEFIDVIHGLDWLKARIQNKVFTPLTQLDKIPYTDAGVDVATSQLRSALSEGTRYGILDEFDVTAPEVVDIASDKRAGRILPDVDWSARLAGAIHNIIINGTVTV